MAEAQILVARQGDVVQVRVIGRATFKISRELREYGLRVIREGIKSFILDFSECRGMDSTFMGVLAMIGLEARNQTVVVIVNADEQHRRLLDGIGISRLFEFAEQPVENNAWKNLCKAAANVGDMQEMAGTIVEAHKTLMDVSPDNVPKFKDVVEMLSAEVNKAEHKKEETK